MTKNINRIRLILTGVLFFILSAIYTYKLNTSFSVNVDFGRDIFEMQKIINGNLTLIGPMLSIGIFASPLYFYFFAPILVLFHQSPIFIVYANAILYSFALAVLFYLLSKKQSLINSALFVLATALLSQTIYMARYPGNVLSFTPFLLFIVCFPFFGLKTSRKNMLILGVLSFISLSFHPISIIGIVPLAVWLIFCNRKNISGLIFYFVSTALFIFPLLLFELRHNFQLSKNFTLHRSLDNLLPTDNILFLKEIITNNFSPYILIAVLISLAIFVRYFKKYSIYEKITLSWSIVSFFLLVLIIPKYEGSYLIPFNVILLTMLYISFSKTKISSLLISITLLLIITKFPIALYQKSTRPISNYENVAKYISDNFQHLKNSNFNIIQASDPGLQTPVGHEYRFFLRKYGLISLPDTNYKEASTLIIFSGIGELDISKIDNWEMNQFGKNFISTQKIKMNNIDIYILNK